jgi:hypothetical protein
MSSNQRWVLGLTAVASLMAVLDAMVEAQDIGRPSGAFSTLRQLGGAFGVAVPVAVFAGAVGYGSRQTFTGTRVTTAQAPPSPELEVRA